MSTLLLESQFPQPLTVTVGKAEVHRMYSLNSELDNGHWAALLPVEENKRLCTFD